VKRRWKYKNHPERREQKTEEAEDKIVTVTQMTQGKEPNRSNKKVYTVPTMPAMPKVHETPDLPLKLLSLLVMLTISIFGLAPSATVPAVMPKVIGPGLKVKSSFWLGEILQIPDHLVSGIGRVLGIAVLVPRPAVGVLASEGAIHHCGDILANDGQELPAMERAARSDEEILAMRVWGDEEVMRGCRGVPCRYR
jgi:hypothetical protein